MNEQEFFVLLVDDDPSNRDILSRRLRRRGYKTVTAENGAEALQLIARQPFDIVLLDIMMPDMDGFTVLEHIRRKISIADLPIIMVTAKDQSDDVIRALRLGANDYVTKPVDFALTLARIETHLAVRRPASAPPPSANKRLPESLRVGSTVSHFKIEEKIGIGGMGEVYRAYDTNLGRVTAIKVLLGQFSADEEQMRRLIREAKTASLLNHPNVATVYDIVQIGRTALIAMEYIAGETLAAKIRRKAFTASETLRIAAQLVDALKEAHARGIIHRDVKPSNIMINRSGLVKLLDFGLAKPITNKGAEDWGQDLTDPGMVKGTPQYMSPEQVTRRDLDHRTDIFSVGVVLYEMLTGRAPFSGSSAYKIFDQILHVEPRFSDDIPKALVTIVRRCLQKQPARRFQSAKELLFAIEMLRRQTVLSARQSY